MPPDCPEHLQIIELVWLALLKASCFTGARLLLNPKSAIGGAGLQRIEAAHGGGGAAVHTGRI
jgi:hypothetical protein